MIQSQNTLFAIFFCMFLSITAKAQILTPEGQPYTRADSLRGTLNENRSCYDVSFYHLDVKVQIENKFISGSNEISYKVINDFTQMQIDLFENMQIVKIIYKGIACDFAREYNAVLITLPEKQKKGEQNKIEIFYHGNPRVAVYPPWDGGISFDKDEKGRDWVGVSCEGLGASVWWPCKDHLSDEPDSMLISISCRKDLQCISNGNLRNTYPDENGYQKFDWFVSYPINNYNVTFYLGNYVHFSDVYESVVDGEKLQLDYYVIDYNLEKAKAQFKQVKPMLGCFEKYMGKYPFYKDGYALIESNYAGMEHQSAIAYGNKYLTGYLGNDYSQIGMKWDYIIIHETGHEWWGNNVSVADIADLWIHEGICTYSEAIYVECLYGYETALNYTNARINDIGNTHPVIGDYGVNDEGDDIYNKGFLIMHTLRHLVNNDELWWNIIRGIQKDFAYQTVSTAQIENYISEKSGMDLSKFFDQYLRHSTPPILEYEIEQNGKKIIVKYRWKADVEGFAMPIKYIDEKGNYKWIQPTQNWQTLILKKHSIADFSFDTRDFYYLVEKIN